MGFPENARLCPMNSASAVNWDNPNRSRDQTHSRGHINCKAHDGLSSLARAKPLPHFSNPLGDVIRSRKYLHLSIESIYPSPLILIRKILPQPTFWQQIKPAPLSAHLLGIFSRLLTNSQTNVRRKHFRIPNQNAWLGIFSCRKRTKLWPA